jgi:hypothetical protein
MIMMIISETGIVSRNSEKTNKGSHPESYGE